MCKKIFYILLVSTFSQTRPGEIPGKKENYHPGEKSPKTCLT